MANREHPTAGMSIAFVGGFNDAGGGRHSVANFAAAAAELNPDAAVRFFAWNGMKSLSAWIRDPHIAIGVIGQSLGGYMAARCALANPGRIGMLVTIDPVSPVSTLSPLDFTWEQLRDSVGYWLDVVQRRNRILALGANWWGEKPARFADGFVSTDFSHGDFFSTIAQLRKTGGLLPDSLNWNVQPRPQ